MLTRTRKQVIYGTGFIVIAALIVWGIGALVTPAPPAPPPTPSPTPFVEPIILEEASAIQHAPVSLGASRTVDLIARLRNPNPRAGVPDYTVTFSLKNRSGQEIGRESATTYLLPGAAQYAVKVGVTITQEIGSLDVSLPEEPAFSSIPVSVSLPQFSSFLRERVTKTIGESVVEEQKGIITNNSGLDWQFVEVVGVAVDAAGTPVGVGQTFVGELKIGEQREFTLSWPAPAAPTSRVLTLPTTNIYRQDNIIRAIGDPGLLR